MDKGKIIIDPVYGFIHLPTGLLLNLVQHPWFRRLSRIKQLGLNNEVYPGAQHTRFQHSLGAYHLMQNALNSIEQKGHALQEEEKEAALCAILLHDIGHGPFSHVLEHTLTNEVSHEDLSLLFMEKLNNRFGGLDRAMDMFRGNYSKAFFHELICSQLDMDRLDYLNRDSFFTGVREGNIGTARIIGMLNTDDENHLVVDSKGIYSIENYLVTRRLMYWQVYLHKTAVAAGLVLTGALRRAKELIAEGNRPEASPALSFFLQRNITLQNFQEEEECLAQYALLDDSDIWMALKQWCSHKDKVLSSLSQDFVNRNLFKVEVRDTPPTPSEIEQKKKETAATLHLSEHEAEYFVGTKSIEKMMYSRQADAIRLLYPNGQIRTMPEVSDLIGSDSTLKANKKFYFCYQRLY